MRSALLAVLFTILLSPSARAGFGTGMGFGSTSDPTYAIEHGTFTPSGTWNFAGIVNISVATATVTALPPLLGNGSSIDPLRVDSSSVTLKGNNVVEKSGDTMSGTLDVPVLVVGGLTDYGARTTLQIRALSCPLRPCRVQSIDDFDIYTDTGTGPGQWRNSRLGTGP